MQDTNELFYSFESDFLTELTILKRNIKTLQSSSLLEKRVKLEVISHQIRREEKLVLNSPFVFKSAIAGTYDLRIQIWQQPA